eukprot:2945925-Heterocapsa_arctica.AAC.1
MVGHGIFRSCHFGKYTSVGPQQWACGRLGVAVRRSKSGTHGHEAQELEVWTRGSRTRGPVLMDLRLKSSKSGIHGLEALLPDRHLVILICSYVPAPILFVRGCRWGGEGCAF